MEKADDERVPMLPSSPKRVFFLSLFVATVAHLGLFVLIIILVVSGLISAKVIDEEPSKEASNEEIQMQMVIESDEQPAEGLAPLVIADSAEEPMPPPEPEVAEPTPPPPPPENGFVQTREDQASNEKPDETNLIGERDTVATSDAGAVAGDEKMTALAGDDERKNDVKTFDSQFSKGENSGPSEGEKMANDLGNGDALENREELVAAEEKPEPQEEKTEMSEPDPELELAEIDQVLTDLEESISKKMEEKSEVSQKVEEEMPERQEQENQKAEEAAADVDGGFAPKTKKTRVRGVLSANGKGSLNVEDTPAGRYEARIYKSLEQNWQMENIRRRSLIAPGTITLYFSVDRNGKVSNQRKLSMNGASTTQWGMVLRALSVTEIPKMPTQVVKDLDGEPLELIVTFNY